jgi:hypothetical protein
MLVVRYNGPGRVWVLRLGSWIVYDADSFISVQDVARHLRYIAREARVAAAAAAAATTFVAVAEHD